MPGAFAPAGFFKPMTKAVLQRSISKQRIKARWTLSRLKSWKNMRLARIRRPSHHHKAQGWLSHVKAQMLRDRKDVLIAAPTHIHADDVIGW